MMISIIRHELTSNGIKIFSYGRSNRPNSISRYIGGYLPAYGKEWDIGIDIFLRISNHNERKQYENETDEEYKERLNKRNRFVNSKISKDFYDTGKPDSNTEIYLNETGEPIPKGKVLHMVYNQLVILPSDTFQSRLNILSRIITKYKKIVKEKVDEASV